MYLLEAVAQQLLVLRVAEIHNVLAQKLLILKELGELRSVQLVRRLCFNSSLDR